MVVMESVLDGQTGSLEVAIGRMSGCGILCN